MITRGKKKMLNYKDVAMSLVSEVSVWSRDVACKTLILEHQATESELIELGFTQEDIGEAHQLIKDEDYEDDEDEDEDE
jgi:hypothetical protein